MTPIERDRAITRVLLVEMTLNLVVAAAKGIYGILAGSLALASDSVHSLMDAASNVVGLVVVKKAQKPPDQDHPYGHHKIEIVAAAGIGVLVGAAAIQFTWSAVEALLYGQPMPKASPAGFVIIGGTMAVNIFVATYEAIRAKQLNSPYLAADAKHTASDVLVTTAVLVAFLGSYLGISWADPVGALIVIVFITRVAWHILSDNIAYFSRPSND